MIQASFVASRRTSILTMLGFALTGCGGGGSGTRPPIGTQQIRSIVSHSNGSSYPLSIYLPPDSEGALDTLPVIYLLDGESRFQALLALIWSSNSRVIIVGIGNESRRNTDYVPANSCTSGGGGQGAFLDFIRLELTPDIEANVGGDPQRRILLGHSHGGSFVLYALFAQLAANHHFSAYLAADASIECMSGTVYGWESGYAAVNASLPVRLHLSYSAVVDNGPFAARVQSRSYSGLAMAAKSYDGGHLGMIPAAFAEGVAFALA
jgi:enterochelin esterase-like enzyme